MPSPIIDPRLSQELIDLLDEHEVPHDSDGLLWEIEKRGAHVRIEGPSTHMSNVKYRWAVGILPVDDASVDRKTVYGQTARIALAKAFQWIVRREEQG